MRIGVVLNILDEEYQISVYKGIVQKAQELGIELVCFQQENAHITEDEPIARFPHKEYFDLDGIITDTAHLHYKAWKQLSEENNLKFDEELNKHLLGVSREDSAEIILKENNVSWQKEKLAEFCKKKNELYVSFLSDLSEKDIFPGIKNLLLELKGKHIPAVLASSSKNAPAILKQLGITDLFAGIADANKIQKAKPEADIFLAAAELSGKWYTNCIGIEDAESGVAAIKKGGMTALAVSPDLSLTQADVQVKSTKEITFAKLVEVMEKVGE